MNVDECNFITLPVQTVFSENSLDASRGPSLANSLFNPDHVQFLFGRGRRTKYLLSYNCSVQPMIILSLLSIKHLKSTQLRDIVRHLSIICISSDCRVFQTICPVCVQSKRNKINTPYPLKITPVFDPKEIRKTIFDSINCPKRPPLLVGGLLLTTDFFQSNFMRRFFKFCFDSSHRN